MTATPGDRMARALLATDLFRIVLEHADSLSGLGRILTSQMRELVGGRVVALLQFDEETVGDPLPEYRLLGVCPERQLEQLEQQEFRYLVAECRNCDGPRTLRMDERAEPHVDSLFSRVLAIPLCTSSELVGMLVFLDLMDQQNVGDVISILHELSTFIAVVMVNGRTYERQERMLAVRTAELRRSIDQLQLAKEESERARVRAEAANEAKSRFLANMSHELRTPLNGVLGMTTLLMETQEKEEQRTYLSLLEKSGKTLLRIINNVLDLARMERGKDTVVIEPFALRSLLEETAALFYPELRDKALEITVDVDPTVPEVIRGDVLKWQQVLYNLVGNAVKFTDAGRITIRAFTTGSSEEVLVVEVTDTGIGIRSEDMNRLFENFTQLDDSHTKRFQGTGLGLAITRQLVTMMGGTIEAHSEHGMGSTFAVRVPLV